ncbi:MAG: exodeoxyribonuclease VII small subunit [Chloroflexi bacterium]|nr:exodeoxyribonuclease VII small subunit [Chloroflexota bacterium]
MPRAAKQQPDVEPFEQLYGRLEACVTRLEQGGLTLDDSIALYEEGMSLARACQERLDGAEQKITRLRETFAPAVASNGAHLNEEPNDYEYVAEEDIPPDEAADFP